MKDEGPSTGPGLGHFKKLAGVYKKGRGSTR